MNAVLVVSHIQLFATPCTEACQPPLSMEFSQQEYGTVCSVLNNRIIKAYEYSNKN